MFKKKKVEKCYLIEVTYADANEMHKIFWCRVWSTAPKAAKKKAIKNYFTSIEDRIEIIKVGRVTSVFHGPVQ